MNINKSTLTLSGYGRHPFCDFSKTPYFDAPAIDELQCADSASLLPPCYQQIVAHFNNLSESEKDVDAFAEATAASVRDGIKALWKNQCSRMMAATIALQPVPVAMIHPQNQGCSDIPLHSVDPPNPTPNESERGEDSDPATSSLSVCEQDCNMDKLLDVRPTMTFQRAFLSGDGKVEMSNDTFCDDKAARDSPKSDRKCVSPCAAKSVVDDHVLVTAECFPLLLRKTDSNELMFCAVAEPTPHVFKRR